jgi:phage terminase large subunit-like protein
LAIAAYRTHRADRIVAEVNNGRDMVGATLRMVDRNVAFTAVRASRGKMVRAEPVAALYDQGRVHHVGTFPQLEDQMTNFTSDIDRAAAGYSPDRVDALVWAFSELLPLNGDAPDAADVAAVTESSLTLRWRGMDSNVQFRARSGSSGLGPIYRRTGH